MNKVAALGLGLATAVYASIAPADVSYAQGKAVAVPHVSGSAQSPSLQPNEIKFGDGRALVYKVDKEPSGQYLGALNRGTILYHPDGGFELWGVLNGIEFGYRHDHGIDGLVMDTITLGNGTYKLRLGNSLIKGLIDTATVNGVYVQLGGSDFYEKPVPTGQWKNLSLKEKLHRVFRDWEKKLNIGAVKREAERLKFPRQKLQESLDTFVIK